MGREITFSLGCGIFEMILKNSSGNIEQPLGYCSHQHIHKAVGLDETKEKSLRRKRA